MPAPDPRLPGVSTKEAAINLGVSEATVRRMIAAGELQAEKIARPGGTLLRVLLDTNQAASSPFTSQEIPASDAVSDSTLVAIQGLVTALVAERERADRLIAENADLREQLGHVRAASEAVSTRAESLAERLALAEARLLALTTPQMQQEPPREPESPNPTPEPSSPFPVPLPPHPNVIPWWRRAWTGWSWLLLVLVMLVTSAWPQLMAMW
jgi:excisionase family DNA binding protein